MVEIKNKGDATRNNVRHPFFRIYVLPLEASTFRDYGIQVNTGS